MDDETERPTAWDEITGRLAVAASPSMPPSASSRTSAASHRTDPEAFAAAIVPCLTLVGGATMKVEERRDWLNAAFKALRDVPLDLLKRGAEVATRSADHPSKIVPAIMAAVEPDLARERQIARMVQGAVPQTTLPAPGGERPTADEADAICKRYGVGRYAKTAPARDPLRPATVPAHADPARPCRKPSREDYIRLGVDPALLDSIESEQVQDLAV